MAHVFIAATLGVLLFGAYLVFKPDYGMSPPPEYFGVARYVEPAVLPDGCWDKSRDECKLIACADLSGIATEAYFQSCMVEFGLKRKNGLRAPDGFPSPQGCGDARFNFGQALAEMGLADAESTASAVPCIWVSNAHERSFGERPIWAKCASIDSRELSFEKLMEVCLEGALASSDAALIRWYSLTPTVNITTDAGSRCEAIRSVAFALTSSGSGTSDTRFLSDTSCRTGQLGSLMSAFYDHSLQVVFNIRPSGDGS